MQKANFIIDPFRIANQMIQGQTEADENIIVEDAKVKIFHCENCKKEKITGITYKLNISDTWEEKHCPLCKDCIDIKELGSLESQIVNRHTENIMDDYWFIENNLLKAGVKDFKPVNKDVINAKRDVKNYLKDLMNDKSIYKNLLIIGSEGTGKSHLATSIARNARGYGLFVGICTLNQLFGKIYASYDKEACKSENQILEDISKFNLFVLDDLCVQCYKKNFLHTKIENIINARQGKPTVFTTSGQETNLVNLLGKRAYSRIKTNTQFVKTGSFDYRNNLKLI